MSKKIGCYHFDFFCELLRVALYRAFKRTFLRLAPVSTQTAREPKRSFAIIFLKK